MDNQVFRSNEPCRRDEPSENDNSLYLDRLSMMNVSNHESSNYLSPHSRYSFENVVSSHCSRSLEIEEREEFEVPAIPTKLSISFSQEYPFREFADSREPEEAKDCDERTDCEEPRTAAGLTNSRSTQDIFISTTSKLQSGSFESPSNNFWASMNSLKRANPVYESDAEYEDKEHSYPNSVRKRRCSIERLTTAVYWQQEVKLADE
jgi:hypothetical protein